MRKKVDLDVPAIVQRYADGESARKIARDCGVSPKTVLSRLKEAGVNIRQHPPVKKYDTAGIVEMYKKRAILQRNRGKA